MKQTLTAILITLACNFAAGQKPVATYYDYAKIHPHEQYYVNAAGQKSGAYKEYNQSGVVIKEYNYLNGVENGQCIDYAAVQGNQRAVAAKGSFKNGVPDGAYVQFCDEDGYKSKVQEGQYKDGKKTGLWKEWWCTEIYDKKYVNLPKSEGYYIEGKMNGQWKNYSETGQMKTTLYDKGVELNGKGAFTDGRMNGLWSFYYNDGSLLSTGNYLNGKETGEWRYYTPQGTLDRKGSFDQGKVNGVWSYYDPGDSTKPIYSGTWSAGTMVGEWLTYFDKDWNETHEKGQFAFYKKTTYAANGIPANGFESYYYISGEKQSQVPIKMGPADAQDKAKPIKDGLYTSYFKNGKVRLEGSYLDDKQTGTWKQYYESGTVDVELEYKNGALTGEKDYYESGKIQTVTKYDQYGRKASVTNYDENGNQK